MNSAVLTFIIVLICLGNSYGWKVKLCEQPDFKGKCTNLIESDGCKNLNEMTWCEKINGEIKCDQTVDKNVSSINTKGTCVVLYSSNDCEGTHTLKVRPIDQNHNDLVYFRNTASSIGPC